MRLKVRKPRATFALLVHVPFTLVSGTVLRIVSFTFQVTYIRPMRSEKLLWMRLSWSFSARAGGVNQQLRKELEPSELESECESEREFEREPPAVKVIY